ncbi:succinate dehydrogenase/fumarate reductase, flavoprotein subunit [Candidatus Scalindua japonica]|uniref:Succinate dehydrogenase/fumarate reductase, flavoprotein subunit n=1 Tax=Candidatus Scalindua japonica TaxID=1284222 RepID=A0A286TVK2_9BACT|nr:hypothetical protein [Candidatus Scalindua japonica]GAX59861.1 succinate dehydrogenase/fumarate reductase, flavoprotein subunit [Candidatus Scalindua japonica]
MNKTNKNINELFHNGTEIDEALQQAVKEALLQHKKAGNTIVSWEKDKMVWIQPEDIVVDVKQDVKP